jgi:hypothetical protein
MFQQINDHLARFKYKYLFTGCNALTFSRKALIINSFCRRYLTLIINLFYLVLTFCNPYLINVNGTKAVNRDSITNQK